MKNQIPLAQRLIVAADFTPPKDTDPANFVRAELDRLVGELEGTGVMIKVNSALRYMGYSLIDTLHSAGVTVMADLKLHDIPATMAADAALLRGFKPEVLTVMASATIDGMAAVLDAIGPDTDVLGVTVLTTMDEEDSQQNFGTSTKAAVLGLARDVALARLAGVVCSGQELGVLAKHKELDSINRVTPGVRPEWAAVKNDDQKRVMTIGQAIAGGAQRIVLGRPITQADDRRAAVLRSIDEINNAFAHWSAGT